jgi:hypothetical protein
MLVAHDRIEKETEDAITAYKKKAENEIWVKTALAMLDLGSGEYSGGAVEKAWAKEKKSGFPHRASIDAVIPGFTSGDTAQKGSGVGNGSAGASKVPVKEECEEEDEY